MLARLIEKFFSSDGSRDNAKSRLQFVLVQDRTGMTNEEMASFKQDLLGVIEKYFTINKDAFDITYKRSGESTTLLINSPVIVRRLEKAEKIKALKAAKKEESTVSQPVTS